MSCIIPVENGVRDAADCKCYSAVMRAYKTMCADSDVPDKMAEEVAVRVYRHHHPEDTPQDAMLTVQCWITAEEHVH